MKATEWKATCDMCGKAFQFQDGFDCTKYDGKHVVESKTYYHLGGRSVNDARTRRFFSPLLTLRPGREGKDPITGDVRHIGGLYAQFGQSGVYTTANPEEQFYLETKYEMPWGDAGLRQWQEVYYTVDQQHALAKEELLALQAKINEQNSLLESTKAQQESNAKRSGARA